MHRLAAAFLESIVLAILFAMPAGAAILPDDRPLVLVVPGAAGGNSDVQVRMLGDKLGAAFGQTVVVENRAGAGGRVAREYVSRLKSDGHVLLFGSVGTLCAASNGAMDGSYDPLKDFDTVTLIGRSPAVLVVNPQLPVKTLTEFIAYAKANPGKITYGTPGEDSAHHVVMMYLEQLTGIQLVHVPYKSGPQALVDLMSGQIQAAVDFPPVVGPHVIAGKMRALAVTGDKRVPLLPDVPSATEAGLPAFGIQGWAGLVTPAGTSPELLSRLAHDVGSALKQPDISAAQARLGVDVTPGEPREFASFLQSECKLWSSIIARGRK